MIIARFEHKKKVRYGLVEGDRVRPLSGDPFGQYTIDADRLPLAEVALLAPVQPSKIVCVGVNYRAHADEMNKSLPASPLLFLKPPSAILGPGGQIRYPETVRRVDFEAEMAVVIGKEASRIRPEEVDQAIFGYTCFNDVTARELQKLDGQWTRAKGFDTFAPAGPWIATELDPQKLSVESYLNGERRQSGHTSDLIFPVRELVSFISQVMTLYPGDLVSTGTPSGIGPMKPGDRIEVIVEGVGCLKNIVV
jgi:2-keto-4-pentenoate hydratase/2-oxohepta-3-ene-1,7-dioic acid hydratase in catechol pathway